MLFYVVAHDFNFSLFLIERFSLDLDVMFEDALEMRNHICTKPFLHGNEFTMENLDLGSRVIAETFTFIIFQ